MAQMDQAVELICRALDTNQTLLIVGDFDCDGATGTAVLHRGLRLLGASDVHYRIPDRMRHGYGLSEALVGELNPGPGLLVTVDSGIACSAGVAAAKAKGWQVLVTDHHLPGQVLPAADVILNPNSAGDQFASKAMCGVGVVFYLLMAVAARLKADAKLPEPVDLAGLLDLVAIGTVADMVPLDENNRRLVAAGLRRIRQGQAQAGVRALLEVAGRSTANCSASDIGFALAPRINAAGRLEDMSIGIECLLCDDYAKALHLAQQLNGINSERKAVQQQMVEEAQASLHSLCSSMPGDPNDQSAICLFNRSWHPGVIGLVASRLKDQFHVPAAAFAPAGDGSSELRGSLRSIKGVHIRDVLVDVDSESPGLIHRFGGHAMAAGLSLSEANFDAFQSAFTGQVARRLNDEIRQVQLLSDGPLQSDEFSFDHAQLLALAGPWGQGFSEPLFDDCFEVIESRIVGRQTLQLFLRHVEYGLSLRAVQFQAATELNPGQVIHAAFELGTDQFRGRRGVQLILRDFRPINP